MKARSSLILYGIFSLIFSKTLYSMKEEDVSNENIPQQQSHFSIDSNNSGDTETDFKEKWKKLSFSSLKQEKTFLKEHIKFIFAQKILGALYAKEKKYDKAIPFLTSAGEGGHAGAWVNLAVVYLNRQGENGARLFSMKNLSETGEVYYRDKNDNFQPYSSSFMQEIEKDVQQAMLCLEKASQQNWKGMTQERIAEAKHQWAELYLDSRPHNYEKAIPLFEESGNAGHAASWDQLAGIYMNIDFDKSNPYTNQEKAVEYLKKSIELGNSNARFNLGLLYFREEKDTEALNLLQNLNEKDCPGVTHVINTINKRLNPQNILSKSKKQFFNYKNMFK